MNFLMLMDTRQSSGRNIGFLEAYWAALLWAAFILYICILPGDELPDIDFWEINIEDKLAHVGVFGILSIFLVWGNSKREMARYKTSKSVIFTLLIGLSFGVATEAIQGYFIPSRFASISDVIADAVGAALGVWFANIVLKRLAQGK